MFTAGAVAGTFNEALEARTVIPSLNALVAVTVVPGPLAQIVIEPNPGDIGKGMTQQFVAVGADSSGNRISGLRFSWSVEAEGGTIDRNGLFTAGSASGSFSDSIKAQASKDGITESATVSVTIEPDRLAFVSLRENGQRDIYILAGDDINRALSGGVEVQRITRGGVDQSRPAWSPNGRLILFSFRGDIYSVNDDGTRVKSVLDESFTTGEADWSPDGTAIVFQSWEDGKAENYTMDVDGGNRTRLTDNNSFEDHPVWSPDGSKIAYERNTGLNSHIFVMNADGSGVFELTFTDNYWPQWSPDGSQIAVSTARFYSESTSSEIKFIGALSGLEVRRGNPQWGNFGPTWGPSGNRIYFHAFRDGPQSDFYSMNLNSSNVIRHTDDEEADGLPVWAPPRQGLEVSEESVVIPNAASLMPFTVQQATANSRSAIARIETERGSGSGFVIDPGGLLLTNNHVISDVDEITVFLDDGTSYEGEVIGRDLVRDLAVLEIEASNLPWLELGDLSRTPLGAEVLVLGFPLGTDELVVTRGLASSFKLDTGRNIRLIQTDSAINPGNSGGPMLNLQGQVIGVVTSKIVSTSVEGVGFAISVNTVKLYLDRLKAGEVISN